MRSRLLLVVLLACAAAVALRGYSLARPMLLFDDFQMLARGMTWEATRASLGEPFNEHVMPPGRLTTWALVQLAARPTNLPFAAALQGPIVLVVGMLLLGHFVRVELGHPFYGVVAMALFGVSSIYHQAATWYAATFSFLALDTTLLALLAAQAWRQRGQIHSLLGCVLASAFAPSWSAVGVLAGPLCCLYLLGTRRLAFLTPLLGTATFLLLLVPRAAERILHTEHYRGSTAVEAFDLGVGIAATRRAVVESLLPGVVGIGGISFPTVLLPEAWAVVLVLTVWWWRRSIARRLVVLGVAFILCNYVMTYSARARWIELGERMNTPTWNRYHLFAQLGLVLILGGGMQHGEGRWWRLDPSGGLTTRQAKGLCWLIGVLFVAQLPHALISSAHHDPDQAAVLRQIEEMDAHCREYQISADAARSVLPPLEIPLCPASENGWNFLRGSDTPRIHTARAIEQALLPRRGEAP